MSLRAHLWALDQAPVKNPTAVLVLVALADEANDDGEGACPYMDKIIQRARCSERSAQEHLRNLFRARLINQGDPGVARRRYKKTGGRVPRVWDLNLAASWGAVPELRTDEEMLAYSDKIGQRPVRRADDQEESDGVQDLHPTNDDPDPGVQDLHLGDDIGAEQEVRGDVDEGDQPQGCSPPHPWGAAPRTPGVQPPAPFPSVPAYPRPPSPSVDQLTEGAADASGEEGEDRQKNPTLDEIVTWFARRRPDWEKDHPGAIREALTTAIAQELGDLRTAAAALRELAVGKHGDTGSPRRLLRADGKWWANVRPRRTPAEVRLSAGPKCDRPGHERQPADGCVLCAGEVNACSDCPRSATRCEHVDQPTGDVGEKGTAFLPRHLRQRTAEPVAS